jgi:hypothetical protein
MKHIFLIKYLLPIILLILLVHRTSAQTINVDFRNPAVTPTQICFDVFISQGTGYNGGTQAGGEWTSMAITFDLDLATVVPPPPTTTLGSTTTIPPATFSNINNAIVEPTPPIATNTVPGGFAAPYDFEYRITVGNDAQDPLPAVPTLAFTICIPVIGGTVTADPTSDIQLRTSTSGAGSFWSNGVLFSQPLSPFEPQDPLPIELTLFEARTQNCNLSLHWETASEKNLGYFQIEASKDGQQFAPIGQVKPKSSHSLEQRTYKFPLAAQYHNYYFRLKAVDLDEQYAHSKIVYALTPCSKPYGMNVYPNPNYTSRLIVEITSPEEYKSVIVEVLDVAGKLMRTQRTGLQTGLNKVQLPLEDLTSGVYFVQIVGIEQLQAPMKFVRSSF